MEKEKKKISTNPEPIQKDHTFRTGNIYLSALLKVRNYKLLDIVFDNNRRAVFVFEDRDERPEIVKQFFEGSLQEKLKPFISAWGDLRDLIRQMQ